MNHERFEWFAIGFSVCLLVVFLSYVASIKQPHHYGEVIDPAPEYELYVVDYEGVKR